MSVILNSRLHGEEMTKEKGKNKSKYGKNREDRFLKTLQIISCLINRKMELEKNKNITYLVF